MPWPLVLDIVIAVLLAATIWFAVSLNRRLGELKRGRSELESLAGTFTKATERAGDSVGQLAENAEELQARMDEARSIADDLAFLTDRGEKTAGKLDKLVRAQPAAADAAAPAAPAAAPAAKSAAKSAGGPLSVASALSASVGIETAGEEAAAKRAKRKKSGGKTKKAKAVLEAVLDDLPRPGLRAERSERNGPDQAPGAPKKNAPQSSSQDAERELLEALRSAG